MLADVEFHKNVSRDEKLAFYSSLSALCVPAQFGEAFGLYLAEAMAAGVPVVQPDIAAFPEIVEASGAGLIAKPDAKSLADAIERLLLDRASHHRFSDAAHRAAKELY